MKKFFSVVFKKPPIYLFLTLVYLLIITILKWRLNLSINTVLFMVGGILGIYFLDAGESFFHLIPSPFKTIIFQALFTLVSIFIVTSSGSYLASGLVLSIYLQILILQLGEWKIMKSLSGWYSVLSTPVAVKLQYRILLGFIILFLFESHIFIR